MTLPAPIRRESAEHYAWGQGCSGWHLARSPAASVIEERIPPGACEGVHLHRRAWQFFYVLEGVATFERDGGRLALRPHEGIEVGAGVPHAIRNDAHADLRFLVVSVPPSHGDRVPAKSEP